MDKLKETLGPVYKHAFWVSCGAIVVVSMAMWFLSTQLGLSKKTKANVALIDEAFSKAESVNSAGVDAAGDGNDESQIRFHPNEKSAAETERLNARLKTKVAEAWDDQYKQQRHLFVWPAKLSDAFKKSVRQKLESPRWQFTVGDEQIIVDVLKQQDAINQIASERGIDPAELKGKGKYVPYELPIEVALPFPTPVSDEITDVFRRVYRDFIKSHVPTLAEKIGAKWTPTAGMGASSMETSDSMTSRRSVGVDDPALTGLKPVEEIVTWNAENEGHWQTKLTAFADRAAQDFVPTTLQMLYTQEDLWILESLLGIIKTTNGDVKLKHEAAIKEIDFIYTGRDAGEMPGAITLIGQTATSGGGEDSYGAESYGSGEGAESYGSGGGADSYSSGSGADSYGSGDSGGGFSTEGAYGESGTEGGVGLFDPADNRYTDRDYKMIQGAKLREVFAQEPTTEEAYLRVAKRIPVRMGFKMDARKVNQLIVACGNSPLVVEVRQVRINPSATDSSAGGGGGTSSFYGSGGSSGASSYGGSGGDDGMYGAESAGASATQARHDVPVEIYGVILIYNPVDAKTLEVKPDEVVEEPKSGAPATEAAATAATSST